MDTVALTQLRALRGPWIQLPGTRSTSPLDLEAQKGARFIRFSLNWLSSSGAPRSGWCLRDTGKDSPGRVKQIVVNRCLYHCMRLLVLALHWAGLGIVASSVSFPP